jgi:hypothetical protein
MSTSISEKIINKISEALLPAGNPIKERFEYGFVVGRELDPSIDGLPPGSAYGNRQHYKAKLGISPQITAAIGKGILPPAERRRLEQIRFVYERDRAKLNTDSQRSPQREYSTSLADAAKQQAEGKTVPPRTLCEFKGEIASVIAADRIALNNHFREADAILRPYFQPAAERAETLFNEELEAERGRYAKYGLPYDEPSQLLCSLWQAVKACRALAKSDPPTAASGAPLPQYWGGGLFGL